MTVLIDAKYFVPVIVAVSVLLNGTTKASVEYNFVQGGWSDGAAIELSFRGTDSNMDGFITTADQEITWLRLAWSGYSQFLYFDLNSSENLGQFPVLLDYVAYDINQGPVLGDSEQEGVGIYVSYGEGDRIYYESGTKVGYYPGGIVRGVEDFELGATLDSTTENMVLTSS